MASVTQTGRSESGLKVMEGEDTAAWAERVIAPYCGLLREEIKAFGGADTLIRWIRSDDEDEV